MQDHSFDFLCPSCHTKLSRTADGFQCKAESYTFHIQDGIPDFLLPHHRQRIEEFLKGYQAVRKSEGWGSSSLDYYTQLPYRDLSGHHSRVWKLRSQTYKKFIADLRATVKSGSRILDAGAGNGWLAYQLSQQGFDAWAVDVNTDPRDGLGVVTQLKREGKTSVHCVRADFSALPFPHSSFDAVVLNASLHYTLQPLQLLSNLMQLLTAQGVLYVLDTPIYHDVSSGNKMIRQRTEYFQSELHITIPDEYRGSFLTFSQLQELGKLADVQLLPVHYGLRWNMYRLISKLLKRREPATFLIVKVRRK